MLHPQSTKNCTAPNTLLVCNGTISCICSCYGGYVWNQTAQACTISSNTDSNGGVTACSGFWCKLSQKQLIVRKKATCSLQAGIMPQDGVAVALRRRCLQAWPLCLPSHAAASAQLARTAGHANASASACLGYCVELTSAVAAVAVVAGSLPVTVTAVKTTLMVTKTVNAEDASGGNSGRTKATCDNGHHLSLAARDSVSTAEEQHQPHHTPAQTQTA